MIGAAVSLIGGRLDKHLRRALATSDDLVAVTSLTDAEGKPVAAARNRLVLFITNVSEDSAARAGLPRTGATGRPDDAPAGPVHLEVDLMLASNFDPANYLDSLKLLSEAVRFLRDTPVYTPQSVPEMDARLAHVSLSILAPDTETASRIWGMHGGRYVPSVMVRLRFWAIDNGPPVNGDGPLPGFAP